MNSDTVSVERTIDAPPDQIFALLACAGSHSAFDGSGTVRDTRQESEPLALGTKFGMSMKQGIPYKTSNEVIEFEPGRLIAWQTRVLFGLVGGRIWRYELTPAGNGTLLRETWDLSKDKQRAVSGGLTPQRVVAQPPQIARIRWLRHHPLVG